MQTLSQFTFLAIVAAASFVEGARIEFYYVDAATQVVDPAQHGSCYDGNLSNWAQSVRFENLPVIELQQSVIASAFYYANCQGEIKDQRQIFRPSGQTTLHHERGLGFKSARFDLRPWHGTENNDTLY